MLFVVLKLYFKCLYHSFGFYIFWLLKLAKVMSNQVSVLQWIHAVIDMLKIHHLILNRIGIDENKQKFSNSWLVCILKRRGVVTQIPSLTSLLLIFAAKTSMKIIFTNDKIYCNSYHRVPNIITCLHSYHPQQDKNHNKRWRFSILKVFISCSVNP